MDYAVIHPIVIGRNYIETTVKVRHLITIENSEHLVMRTTPTPPQNNASFFFGVSKYKD